MILAMCINPNDESVTPFEAPATQSELEALLEGPLIKKHVLPNGNCLYALREPYHDGEFTIGQSAPIFGQAFVLGKVRGGEFENVAYSVQTIAALVRFRTNGSKDFATDLERSNVDSWFAKK